MAVRLVAYLRELVEKASNPVREVADDTTVWLGEYREYLTPDDPSALIELHRPAPPELGQPAMTEGDAYRRLRVANRSAAIC